MPPPVTLSFQAEQNLSSLQADQEVARRRLHEESLLFFRNHADCPFLLRRLKTLLGMLQYQINERAAKLYAVLDKKLLALDEVQKQVGPTKEDGDVRRLITVAADCSVVEETIKSLGEGFEALRSLNIQSCSNKNKAKEKEMKSSRRSATATATTIYNRKMYGKLTVPRLPTGRGSRPCSPSTVSRPASFPANNQLSVDGSGGGSASVAAARSSSLGLESITCGTGLGGLVGGGARAEDSLGNSLNSITSSSSSSSGSGGADIVGRGVTREGAERWAAAKGVNSREAAGRGQEQCYRIQEAGGGIKYRGGVWMNSCRGMTDDSREGFLLPPPQERPETQPHEQVNPRCQDLGNPAGERTGGDYGTWPKELAAIASRGGPKWWIGSSLLPVADEDAGEGCGVTEAQGGGAYGGEGGGASSPGTPVGWGTSGTREGAGWKDQQPRHHRQQRQRQQQASPSVKAELTTRPSKSSVPEVQAIIKEEALHEEGGAPAMAREAVKQSDAGPAAECEGTGGGDDSADVKKPKVEHVEATAATSAATVEPTPPPATTPPPANGHPGREPAGKTPNQEWNDGGRRQPRGGRGRPAQSSRDEIDADRNEDGSRRSFHEGGGHGEDDKLGDTVVERSRPRLPHGDNSTWRPLAGASRWRPVSAGEIEERIKRARLDVRSFGVPERAWGGGSAS